MGARGAVAEAAEGAVAVEAPPPAGGVPLTPNPVHSYLPALHKKWALRLKAT